MQVENFRGNKSKFGQKLHEIKKIGAFCGKL